MTSQTDAPATPQAPSVAESTLWLRNVYVCLFGSFTTIVGMTVLLPILPLYVAHLGVSSQAAIVQWSGVAFGITFLAAATVSPIWGMLADRYGRKLMLIRASLGMAIMISMMGLAQNVYQLVLLRLLVGLAGGYASGAIILIATQTPKARAAWALGTLSIGVMAGNLVGPLIGGAMPALIGLRMTFVLSGALIFVAFICTTTLIREDLPARKAAPRSQQKTRTGSWSQIPDRRPVFAMLMTALLLMLANMSIEPIITVYVAQLQLSGLSVALMAGLVMSAAALGSILAAPRIGRLADRVGHLKIVIVCLTAGALLLLPQAFVTTGWQLVLLRFLMGLALAGLLPCITTLIRHSVPDTIAGGILGYSQSAQYAGQVVGPLIGGFIGAHLGMRAVFFVTSALMFAGAFYSYRAGPRR
jgi:MFS family permease